MVLIDADEVGRRMVPTSLVEALRRGHETGGDWVVERLLMEGPGSSDSALTWTGWHPGLGLAVKTATVFPRNAEADGRPNVQSVVTLFDAANGSPVAAIHGESFTRMKTAADSALGVALLANPEVESLAVLGAGAQAESQVRFIMALRPSIRRVAIWNRSPRPAERLTGLLRAEGVDCRSVPEPMSAVEAADVVTCVTSSSRPVLEGAWLRPGCHVDLVGAYTPQMRECDDEVVRRGRLYADSRRFGIAHCGDYAQPIADGVIRAEDIVGDLFELCSGRAEGRLAPTDITVFKNGGGGHLDLMAAAAFHAWVRGSDRPGRETSAAIRAPGGEPAQ